MRKGRVIIDFESNEEGNCSWDITCEGQDKLDTENLKTLLETVLTELMTDEFDM
jgi:hypothetical protein